MLPCCERFGHKYLSEGGTFDAERWRQAHIDHEKAWVIAHLGPNATKKQKQRAAEEVERKYANLSTDMVTSICVCPCHQDGLHVLH